MKTYFTRIVTFMDYSPLSDNPKELLVGGSRTITQGDKVRVFVVCNVCYDESVTPLYSDISKGFRYKQLCDLLRDHPNIDCVILDRDKKLSVFDYDKTE